MAMRDHRRVVPSDSEAMDAQLPSAATHDQSAEVDERWSTALTAIAPNSVMVRGYHLDELMGRLSFPDAVYLLLMGELPTRTIGRMLDAILVSVIDHGVTPPSTLAARATS